MSFRVSFSFIPCETIVRWRLIKLFQHPMLPAAETALNKDQISICFRVSVVPLLIHLLNETENNWHGSKMCSKKHLRSPQWLRNLKFKK